MKNLSGAAKYSVAILALVTFAFVFTLSMGAFAQHDAIVTITPNVAIASC